MADYHEFKRLVNERKRLGKRRRKLLEFIANNPGATPYKIAQAIYDDPLVYHRTVVKMLEMIRKRVPGILEEMAEGRIRYISLTGKGLDFCRREGIIAPTTEAGLVVKFISDKMLEDASLTFEESGALCAAFTEKVCKTALEIHRSTHQVIDVDIGYQILSGLWAYETEGGVKDQYKYYPDDVAKLYAPVINAGLIPRKKIKKWAKNEGEKYIIPEVEKRLKAVGVVKFAGFEKDFDDLLKVLNPIVKRSPNLNALKEDLARSHQAYVGRKLLDEVGKVAVGRAIEIAGFRAPQPQGGGKRTEKRRR